MKKLSLLLWGLGLAMGLPVIHLTPAISLPGQSDPTDTSAAGAMFRKITFDLSSLSPERLYGSGNEARSLSYEL